MWPLFCFTYIHTTLQMSPKIIPTGVDLEVYSVGCANYWSTDLTSDNGHLLGYWPLSSCGQNLYCTTRYHVRIFGKFPLSAGQICYAYCSGDDPGKDIIGKNPYESRQGIHCSEIKEFSVELHMCYSRSCTKWLRMSVLTEFAITRIVVCMEAFLFHHYFS